MSHSQVSLYNEVTLLLLQCTWTKPRRRKRHEAMRLLISLMGIVMHS